MTTEVTVILISTAAILIGVFFWKRCKAGMRRINTATERRIAEIIAAERNDVERMWKILAQQIESLQSNIEHLQKGFDTLKEVDEKIIACLYTMDGAVQHQSLPTKTGKQEKATSKKTEKEEK